MADTEGKVEDEVMAAEEEGNDEVGFCNATITDKADAADRRRYLP